MQTGVLNAIDDQGLRAYVVWVPILTSDSSPPDEATRALVPDARAMHYWDARRALPDLFAPLLQLPPGSPAWDVYLAYPPGVTWEQAPPAPSFWQHQLGDLASAPPLDGASFAAQARELLP